MKVLCLFNKVRTEAYEKIKRGEESDNFLWGMLRLQQYGCSAETIELESVFSPGVCRFLRKRILNIHTAHIPFFHRIFAYDIVFTSTAFGTMLLWALWPFRKPKWVMFEFNLLGIIGGRKTLRQKVFAWAASRVSGILTLSDASAEALKKEFPHLANKIRFIALGTDIKYFHPIPDIPEENMIFSPGRDPGRDFKTFFDAVKDVNVRAEITQRPAKLAKFGVPPANVSTHDYSPREMLDRYARAKVVVLPLNIGNEPLNAMGCSTMVEAMAMGKAIIATYSETMKSHMKDGVEGIFVPQHDPEAMKSAILDLLHDDAKRKRLGAAARKAAEERLEADNYAKSLAEYFRTA